MPRLYKYGGITAYLQRRKTSPRPVRKAFQITKNHAWTSSVRIPLLFGLCSPEQAIVLSGLGLSKIYLLQSFPGFELRRYEMSQWVATRDLVTRYDAMKNSNMFYKLFHYISGKNTLGMKMPMTAPVLRTVIPGVGRNNQQTVMEMHFMIPYNMQPFPPSPTDPTVYITTLPPLDVYVKSFGGFTNHRMNLRKVEELKNQINNRNLYHGDHFYTAGYDGPSSMNRHNEVWLVAKN